MINKQKYLIQSKISKELNDLLEEHCKSKGLKKGTLLRMILIEYFNNIKKG